MSSTPPASPSLVQTEIISILVREILEPRARSKCTEKISDKLNQTYDIRLDQLPAGDPAILEDLREHGVHFPNLGLSRADIEDIRSHFLRRRPPVTSSAAERFNHPISDVIAAPRLLELALSDKVMAPLTRYFGTIPFLTGMRVWWLENGPPLDADQVAHRDNLDVCFCKLFIYLTDVGPEDAPHKFYKGTHNYARVKKKLVAAGVPPAQLPTALHYFFEANFGKLKSDITDLFKDELVTITGEAGTSFIADTWAIHRAGIPAPGHHRLMFSAIYGMNLDPVDYEAMATLGSMPGLRERIGESVFSRHAMRPWM